MILVFGGTTEGRTAAGVLEAAGTPYYYSTRGTEQVVDLVHGERISGGMDVKAILEFCRKHDIRLLVDAGHPFAEELHRTVAIAAKQAGVPLVRYERIFPPHTDDIIWCKDYEDAIHKMESAGIHRLLALTGVQTIGRLKPFWQKHDCWFRILDRDSSRQFAARHDFPKERLIQMHTEEAGIRDEGLEIPTLITSLQPQAILTKESGLSGGFQQKVEAAHKAGIPIFAVERPKLPFQLAEVVNWNEPQSSTKGIRWGAIVNGPHGLRRAVERLLPEFYPLKSGLTTGTCATAAAVADWHRLQTGKMPSEVPVRLPDGETIMVPVGFSDGFAYCIKDAGDDPDVTNGIEVRAKVQPADHFEIKGGEGVGRFTLPGFDFPPGEPAINRGPRQMLRENIQGEVAVTISVKNGAEIARRTFNPRLGIEGGISIIGVSGIVQPYSEEAFLESIRKCMEVAKASGAPKVVIGSGAKSEKALRNRYPELPPQAFVQYGNYVGATLHMAADLGIEAVTVGVMLGKAVKLAAGQLDTHSRQGTFDRTFLQQLLNEADCDIDISHITLVRELWNLLPNEQTWAFADKVLAYCRVQCQALLPTGQLTILLIDDEGNIWE